MIHALEESYLNDVIPDFLGHTEADGAVRIFKNDPEAVRLLIPKFAEVVSNMIRRDLIEIREPVSGIWHDAPPMSKAAIEETLADPDTWLWDEDMANRMVMLMTTETVDRLLGR